jgi:L-iditol 2-dehydrogenase
MSETMKAAVLERLNELTVQQVPRPEIGDTEILIKVGACAVCGSDIRMFRHGNPRLEPPAIMGHEASGEVVAVGSKVKGFKEGDRLALGGDMPCGKCDELHCKTINNCPLNYAMGYQFPGSFAEYVKINELVWDGGPASVLPDTMPFEQAALCEPLACCINAMEMCRPEAGDTMVVVGAGPLGIMLTELGKQMGIEKTIVINRSPGRLEVAKQFGVDVTICSSEEDAPQRILDETNGHGADIILTACPSPEAQAQTLEYAAHRARINFFGGLPKGQSVVPIDTNILHYKEIYMFGSHGAAPEHLHQAVQLAASGGIDLSKYISHRFPLDEAPKAFEAAESKAGMRVVITP